jgi:hypothetical protein
LDYWFTNKHKLSFHQQGLSSFYKLLLW